MAYDKGSIGTVEHQGGSRYRVESFKERGNFYDVNLSPVSCSCPFHQKKLVEEWAKGQMLDVVCKHVRAARNEAENRAYRKALAMEPERLRSLLQKKTYRPEIEAGMKSALREMEIQQDMERYSYWPFLWMEEAA